MRRWLVVLVVLGLVMAACQVPIPVCEERTERWAVWLTRDEFEVLSSGGFRVTGRVLRPNGTFANCAEFCRGEEDVKRVQSCTEPVLRAGTPLGGDRQTAWRLECEAEVIHCEVPRTEEPGPPLL